MISPSLPYIQMIEKLINMRIILKPRGPNIDFPVTAFDVEINSTVDHIIAHLTLKYNHIDATTLSVYHKSRLLPYDGDIYKLNIMDNDELEVGIKEKNCCVLL